MMWIQPRTRHGPFVLLATAAITLGAGATQAGGMPTVHEGTAVPVGNGTAHTFVRSGANGEPVSIGIAFSPAMLDGLPSAAPGESPDFPYPLPMPATGPKSVVDHIVITWESAGHPPAHVYDVQHFDFHFYLISAAEREKISFSNSKESGDPGQQPPAELVPAGYVVPPGTAKAKMGVHAINPAAPEFQNTPFTATFIYGYFNKKLIFIEPMATLAFLKSMPSYTAPVTRPATYSKPGAYPSGYSIRYDATSKMYEVTLEDFK